MSVLFGIVLCCMLEISRGNLFDLLTTQGSVFSTVFVVTSALAYGCVNTNIFVVPMAEQLHIQTPNTVSKCDCQKTALWL